MSFTGPYPPPGTTVSGGFVPSSGNVFFGGISLAQYGFQLNGISGRWFPSLLRNEIAIANRQAPADMTRFYDVSTIGLQGTISADMVDWNANFNHAAWITRINTLKSLLNPMKGFQRLQIIDDFSRSRYARLMEGGLIEQFPVFQLPFQAVTFGFECLEPWWRVRLPDVTLTQSGIIQKNMVLNPSFIGVSTNYCPNVSLDTGGTIIPSGIAYSGSTSMQLGLSGAQRVRIVIGGSIAPGMPYQARIYLKGLAGGEQVTAILQSQGTPTLTSSSVAATLTSDWTPVNVNWTPSQSVSDPVLVLQSTTGGMTTFYADAAQAAVAPLPSDFFTGDSPGCTWLGVSNGSASERATPGAIPYAGDAPSRPYVELLVSDVIYAASATNPVVLVGVDDLQCSWRGTVTDGALNPGDTVSIDSEALVCTVQPVQGATEDATRYYDFSGPGSYLSDGFPAIQDGGSAVTFLHPNISRVDISYESLVL